jgi:anti-sigma28 factor (negative regulator of flagellin synthesis)
MRIDEAYAKLQSPAMDRAKAAGGPASAKSRAEVEHGGDVRVTLSARAQELSSSTRIEALRGRLAAGRLEPDARAIATKLLGGDA